MTAVQPSGPAGASIGWLLRLGARTASSSALAVLVLAGILATSQVVWRTLGAALLVGDPALRLEGTLLVSGAAMLITAALARAVVLAVTVQSGATWLRTVPGSPAIPPARAALRGIAWAALAVLVNELLTIWFWGVLVASGVATALGGPVVSLLGIAGVAGVLSLGLLIVPAAGLWLELGLVTSVTRPARLGDAAGAAGMTLLRRPGTVVALWLVTAVPAGFLAAGLQVLQAGTPGPGRAAAAAGGAALVLVALIEALATLIRLDALAALVLDGMGELPRQPPRPTPPPVPIPVATLVPAREVVEARPVGPIAPWNPGTQR
jgi:hypothetical protein